MESGKRPRTMGLAVCVRGRAVFACIVYSYVYTVYIGLKTPPIERGFSDGVGCRQSPLKRHHKTLMHYFYYNYYHVIKVVDAVG